MLQTGDQKLVLIGLDLLGIEMALAGRVRREALDNYLADNVNAWELGSDGSYRLRSPAPGEKAHVAQLALLAEACE